MKAAAWGAVALAFLLLGCHSEIPAPGDPLTLPPAAEVEQIEVTRWAPNGSYQSSFKIHDRRRIEEILAALQSINRNFYLSMDGMEGRQLAQEYSLALAGHGKLKAMIYISPTWLGGVDKHHEANYGMLEDRYRELSQADHAKLLALVRE
jgi:hypothetical protein